MADVASASTFYALALRTLQQPGGVGAVAQQLASAFDAPRTAPRRTQRRKQRQERALVSQLPAHLKAQRQRMRARQALVEERRARKLARMQAEGIAGFRVGKHVVPKQHVDVQTGDELSESLRQLKPEGNLFYDRFQNLQARGLLEARKPVVPSRRYKLREYDRHSFKRDD